MSSPRSPRPPTRSRSPRPTTRGRSRSPRPGGRRGKSRKGKRSKSPRADEELSKAAHLIHLLMRLKLTDPKRHRGEPQIDVIMREGEAAGLNPQQLWELGSVAAACAKYSQELFKKL